MRLIRARGGSTSPDGPEFVETNRNMVSRAYGPIRVRATSALLLLALVFPMLPDRPAMIAWAALSLVGTLVVRRLVPSERHLIWFAAADIAGAAVAGLLVPELWVVTMLVVGGVVLITTTIGGAMPLPLLLVSFVGGIAPALAHGGRKALAAIAVGGVVLGVDHWMKGKAALIALHDQTTLQEALETSSSLVHVTSLGYDRTFWVQGPVEQISGYTVEEWLALNPRSMLHPDDVAAFVEIERTTTWTDGQRVDHTARIRHKDGHWVWMRSLAVVTREDDGRLYLRGTATDVTEAVNAQVELRRQTTTDPLTGLANREVLMDELDRRCKAGGSFGLLLLDLDRFKQINDTLGHHVGDEVLREIAGRLSELAGDGDVVCRLGGDEFAIVTDWVRRSADASELANRIAMTCRRDIRHHDVTLRPAASIGIAIANGELDAATIMRQAELAMYRAKADDVPAMFFADEMIETSVEEFELSSALPTAIAAGELELYFQPKVDLADETVVGFEGLIRWDHSTLGVLTPNRFLHLIDSRELEHRFVDVVVAQGIEFAARCRDAGLDLPVSVNLSTHSFLDERLPDQVRSLLVHHDVPAAMLVIEITEVDIMDRITDSAPVMARWRSLGVGISIDDFGTGYSSFARLIDMPITEVKIDRRFVQGSTADQRDEIIVRSIADLAHRMRIDLVAEGIETAEQAELLLDAGCRTAQGFRYARPMPPDDAFDHARLHRRDATADAEATAQMENS